ncbi:MAG: PDZ domain-containing protein [Acidobacteria bacterium]|nr:PDZ domain-containing protein [Acidobacteriota bacterium]
MGVLRDGQKHTLNVTPERPNAAWSVGIDGERLRRDIERGLRDLPDMRELRFDGPAFDFRVAPRMSPRSRLGVQVDELSPQLADYFGATAGGVLVTDVPESSAAAKAGLKAGDVITSVNGAPVRDYGALARELQASKASKVTVGVLRDRKAMTFEATVENDRPSRRPVGERRPA